MSSSLRGASRSSWTAAFGTGVASTASASRPTDGGGQRSWRGTCAVIARRTRSSGRGDGRWSASGSTPTRRLRRRWSTAWCAGTRRAPAHPESASSCFNPGRGHRQDVGRTRSRPNTPRPEFGRCLVGVVRLQLCYRSAHRADELERDFEGVERVSGSLRGGRYALFTSPPAQATCRWLCTPPGCRVGAAHAPLTAGSAPRKETPRTMPDWGRSRSRPEQQPEPQPQPEAQFT